MARECEHKGIGGAVHNFRRVVASRDDQGLEPVSDLGRRGAGVRCVSEVHTVDRNGVVLVIGHAVYRELGARDVLWRQGDVARSVRRGHAYDGRTERGQSRCDAIDRRACKDRVRDLGAVQREAKNLAFGRDRGGQADGLLRGKSSPANLPALDAGILCLQRHGHEIGRITGKETVRDHARERRVRAHALRHEAGRDVGQKTRDAERGSRNAGRLSGDTYVNNAVKAHVRILRKFPQSSAGPLGLPRRFQPSPRVPWLRPSLFHYLLR